MSEKVSKGINKTVILGDKLRPKVINRSMCVEKRVLPSSFFLVLYSSFNEINIFVGFFSEYVALLVGRNVISRQPLLTRAVAVVHLQVTANMGLRFSIKYEG